MNYTPTEIKTFIDIYCNNFTCSSANEICNYIFELIVKNNVEGSEDITKYISNKEFLPFNNFLLELLFRERYYNELKNHKDEESFQLFFEKINLTHTYINSYSYKDYEFYDCLVKLSKTCCIMTISDNRSTTKPNLKISIDNELIFLLSWYNCLKFVIGKIDNKFLEYFEEVCSTTDFSSEYS